MFHQIYTLLGSGGHMIHSYTMLTCSFHLIHSCLVPLVFPIFLSTSGVFRTVKGASSSNEEAFRGRGWGGRLDGRRWVAGLLGLDSRPVPASFRRPGHHGCRVSLLARPLFEFCSIIKKDHCHPSSGCVDDDRFYDCACLFVTCYRFVEVAGIARKAMYRSDSANLSLF